MDRTIVESRQIVERMWIAWGDQDLRALRREATAGGWTIRLVIDLDSVVCRSGWPTIHADRVLLSGRSAP